MSDHQCPATGCDKSVPVDQLMCPRHWYMVPRPIRSSVWNAYRGPGPGSAQHAHAVTLAIRAVNDRLAEA